MNPRIPPPEAEAARRQGPIDGLQAAGDICCEAIAASPFGVLVHDAGGRILLFNARLERITGYAAGEIPDIPTWIRLIYPNEEYRRIVLEEPRSASPPAAVRTREAMITRRDGRTETCRFTSVRNESGLRIVFIQPVDEPPDPAALPEAGEPGYRFLYQSCPLPTLLWKRRAEGFCLISFNTAARQLLGDELEHSLGRPPASVLASVPEFLECMQRCLADRQTRHKEFRIKAPGEERARHLRITFIGAGSDYVTAYAEDLTQLRRTEAELQQKESRDQEMLDMLPETVFEMDTSGRILFVNRNGHERFGVTPEDVERGFYPFELLTLEDRERAQRNMARVLAGDRIGPNEYTAILKDGRRSVFMVHSQPIVREGRSEGLRGLVVDITERKRLEAVLRESEARLRLAVEAARIGIYTTDLETGIRQWSPELCAIAGRAPGSIQTDADAWGIVHPEDRARVLATHRRALDPNGSGDFHSEHRIVRPDGDVRWIVWQGRTFFRDTPSGRVPIRRLGACIDVTERKLAEIALRLSESKFSQMFNASPHGLSITTFDEGRYLEANPAECALIGYSREELIGCTVHEIGFYDNPEDSREIRRLLAEHGTLSNYRLQFRRKSGERRWAFLSASLVEFGGQKCLLSTASDISDLQKAEEALMLSEERLRIATEGANVGWWDWDLRRNAVFCNDIYYRMLGYPQREAPATSESWKELIHPDDRAAAVGSLNRALAGSPAVFREEYRMRCGDGTWRWVLDIGRVFERDAEGRPVRAIGIHIDIHNLKTAEEELSRYNQELETRVAARTAALEELNESLRREIDARGRVEAELRARTEELAEINNALRVVLRKNREESEDDAQKMASSIRKLAFPHLEKLKLAGLSGRQKAYLQLLEEALSEIVSAEQASLASLQEKLTPGEYQVAALIRQGKTSKQLSEIMSLSCRTIESHRKSIRRKLGLQHSRINLRSHLAFIDKSKL